MCGNTYKTTVSLIQYCDRITFVFLCILKKALKILHYNYFIIIQIMRSICEYLKKNIPYILKKYILSGVIAMRTPLLV